MTARAWPLAFVFDLDGTLVETAPDLHLVLKEVLAEEGLAAPPLEDVRTMIGDGARALVRRGLEALGEPCDEARLDELYDRFLARYTAEPCRASHLYDGAAPLLEALTAAGRPLGICTNKPQRPSELLLEALGIGDRFAAVVGGDTVPGVRKPDARHLAAVLERLEARPRDAVMIGDSHNDLLTARALEVPCVLVSFGYTATPARELGADAVIDRFEELLPALERLARAA